MNNRHNPIARKIEELQRRWFDATEETPDYKLIRWLIDPEEAVLINGFYCLESSAYGSLPEFFVVMLTPFESEEDFSLRMMKDWADVWNDDPSVEQSGIMWDPLFWVNKAEKSEKADLVLVEMLTDFQEKVCDEEQLLVISLIPRSVSDFYAFNSWLIRMVELLPPAVRISLVDHLGENYLKDTFKYFKEEAVTIPCGDLELRNTVKQMATAGDPNDPEVGFRKCLFEMGEGASSKKDRKIEEWGEKAVLIAQRSGSKSFLATAYLVYAGFLMQLRNEKADALLDKAIAIAKNGMVEDDPLMAGILVQLYGYKAAYQSIKGKKSKSAEWMLKQARFATEHNMGAYAISIARMAARMAKKAGENALYRDSLLTGYQAGEKLTEEELKTSEIVTIAYYYAEELEDEKRKEEAWTIREKMKALFGEEWDKDVISFSDKYGQTFPDVNKTINELNLN